MMSDVVGSWEDDLDLLMEQHDDKAELLLGEMERHRVQNVAISESLTDTVKGTLIFTNYRLMWVGHSTISIPWGCVSKVEEVLPTSNGYGVLYAAPRRNPTGPYPVTVHSKDGRWFKFILLGSGDDMDFLLDKAHELSIPFAFCFRSASGDRTPRTPRSTAAALAHASVRSLGPPSSSPSNSTQGSSTSESFVLLGFPGEPSRSAVDCTASPPLAPLSPSRPAPSQFPIVIPHSSSCPLPPPLPPTGMAAVASIAGASGRGLLTASFPDRRVTFIPNAPPTSRHSAAAAAAAPGLAPASPPIPIPSRPVPAGCTGSSPGSTSSNGSLTCCNLEHPFLGPPPGWFYDPRVEFARMGIDEARQSGWRVSTSLNAEYEVCASYPKVVCVPANASDDVLKGSANFRSKGRFPVLCWRCAKTGKTITRSSQPLVGLRFNRCPDDEQLLTLVRRASAAKLLHIFDCRPKFNAVANTAICGGYESGSHYDKCKLLFCGIPNLHTMRDSLERLQQLAARSRDVQRPYSDANYLSSLESTQWLDHIRSLMILSMQIVELLEPSRDDAVSVLVHCSDGWDRTSQLCSLAQVLLDPYYRTLQGFITLIEKDWLSMGHKFGDRCGNHINGPIGPSGSSDQCAPIFLQFICCVQQIMEQFPASFEFNEPFLFWLLEHHVSCLYGTFLGNSERERLEADIAGHCYSMWDKVSEAAKDFTNLWYDRRENQGALHPDPSMDKLAVWATGRRSHAETRVKSLMQERQLEVMHRLLKYKAAYTQLKKRQLEGELGPIRTEDLSDEAAGAVLVTKVPASPPTSDASLPSDAVGDVVPYHPLAPLRLLDGCCGRQAATETNITVGLADAPLIENYFSS